MKILRRFSLGATNALWLSLAAGQHALATGGVFGPIPTVTGDPQESDIRLTVINILKDVLSLMALVAVVVIVIAGIRLVVTGADETQREKARNTVLYAIVGLVLILLARAIVTFVNSFLTSAGT